MNVNEFFETNSSNQLHFRIDPDLNSGLKNGQSPVTTFLILGHLSNFGMAEN